MAGAALRAGLCLASWLLAQVALAAAPTGALRCPDAVTVLVVFDCTLDLAIDSDAADVTVVPVAVQLPDGRPLLRVAEAAPLRHEPDTRRIVGDVPLRQGQRLSLPLSLLVADTGPHRGPVLHLRLNGVDSATVLPLAPRRDTDLGLWRWPWPPWVTFVGLLAVLWLSFLALRAWARQTPRGPMSVRARATHGVRGTPGGGALLVVVVLAMTLLLLPMAVDNLRSRFGFEATRCQLLDRSRVVFSDNSEPVLALRYPVAGVMRVSAGYAPFGRSLPDDEAEHFLRLSPGTELPCWYDPLRPERVIVVHNASALAVAAAGLPVLLVLALRRLARIRRFE